jgi:LPXTG-site transpeptidase (sortase) family protein
LFGPKNKEVVSLGNDPSVLSVQSRYSPQYFSNVDKNIAIISKELENNLSDYSNLQGFFYLSIPKLGFEKLPVQLNVESYDKESYEKVLKNYLAHFKGSSIPDKPGTTFVYGHSSPEWYAKINPKSVTTAFTFLPKLTIGDSISVEYNGHTYNYTVVKIKEVDPYDLSPVFQNDGRKLLALMTCIPVGIGTDRLIVVAEQI